MGKEGQAVLKDGQTTLLRRPLQLLYPLEINCQIGEQTSVAEDLNSTDEEESERTGEKVLSEHAACRCSQQTAARQANNQLKPCLFVLKEN